MYFNYKELHFKQAFKDHQFISRLSLQYMG